MNTLRLIYAVVLTACWGTARYLIAIAEWRNDGRRQPLRRDSFIWSARSSPKAMRCSKCGWTGPLRFAKFTYVRAGYGPDCDVEKVEVCPTCQEQDTLWAVFRSKGGWSS